MSAEVSEQRPRTAYRPAVDYLADALRGQGKVIAKHVDAHLTNERVLELAGAIDRAVAVALREQLRRVAEDVLAMQVAGSVEDAPTGVPA